MLSVTGVVRRPATQRPSGRRNPAITINAPLSRKAPTAAGKPPSIDAEVARRAAPGVDQATLIGIRVRIADTAWKETEPRIEWVLVPQPLG